MNRELEIRERVALYGLELTGHDREALYIARGNLEFYAYSDLRYLLSENARLRADLAAMTQMRDGWMKQAGEWQEHSEKCAAQVAEVFQKQREAEAEADAWRRRAGAAEKDIRDMLYDATLLVDNGLCDWCGRWDNELCWSNDCKAECKWRGPEEDKP